MAALLHEILSRYGFNAKEMGILPFGTGLINRTWRVARKPAAGKQGAGKQGAGKQEEFILQRINDQVFKTPEDIAHNVTEVADYLHKTHPGYLFVSPITTTDGKNMVRHPTEGCFRIFPFVSGSHTTDVVSSPLEAYEAASAFGRFTALLADFDPARLRITLPDFHDLSLRYQQFLDALHHGNPARIQEAATLIEFIRDHRSIATHYEQILQDPGFRVRVIHHDTKISNILFDKAGKSLCVIDTDTMMPGYFISDLGDMMRTYLPPVSEEEKDFSKITVREDIYAAIIKGYCGPMREFLTATEKEHFVYAGKFMIYMQAIRFLTDHLNNDVYYGARYEGHNFVRAGNQVTLLQRLIEKETDFSDIRC